MPELQAFVDRLVDLPLHEAVHAVHHFHRQVAFPIQRQRVGQCGGIVGMQGNA